MSYSTKQDYEAQYKAVMLDLKQGKYAPAYMLCGEEPYYIDKVCDYIETHILDEMAREFDQMVFYGKDLEGDITPVISAARGFAMMGGNKVVIVKEAQNIKKWDALKMYMENKQPSTILVFCYKYGTPDKRMSVFKDWKKNGGVMMESNPLRDYEVQGWISNYIRQRNEELRQQGDSIQIDDRVTALLAANIGTDLTQIVNALQKLINGRPEGKNVIDADLVERNIGISKNFNIFELQKALINGDHFKAQQIGQYFASSKKHPINKELSTLYTFFANLMVYHYLPDKSPACVAGALGIAPFFARDYAAAAQRFSPGKTVKILSYFRDIDARSKGINNPSAQEADLWKELIYKMLH